MQSTTQEHDAINAPQEPHNQGHDATKAPQTPQTHEHDANAENNTRA